MVNFPNYEQNFKWMWNKAGKKADKLRSFVYFFYLAFAISQV